MTLLLSIVLESIKLKEAVLKHFKPIPIIVLALLALSQTLVVSTLLLFENTADYIPVWLPVTSKLAAMACFVFVAVYQVVIFRQFSTIRYVAYLVCAALILSMMGDIVNFNLSGRYYRHGEQIKHDYLVDSVWFFMPAYVCYCIATIIGLVKLGVEYTKLTRSLMITSVFGLLSYLTLVNSAAGSSVIVLTSLYSIVIALPLALAFGLVRWVTIPQNPLRLMIPLGLVLATLADAVIAKFWLFADEMNSYYPAVREWNWILYSTSQACLSFLPLSLSMSIKYQIDNKKSLTR